MNDKGLKILFLSPRFPYPLIGGDRIKSYNLLKHLCKKHEVHLVTFHHGGDAPKEYIEGIEKIGVKLHTIPLNPMKAGLKAASRLLRYPLEIGFYNQPEFQKCVDELCDKIDFDLGFSFFLRTTEYIKNKKFKKVLIAEDCRTLYQSRSYSNSRNIIQKAGRYWETLILRKYEPKTINYFDVTTFVTNDDIIAMRKQAPDGNYRLLTNGVDQHHFALPENEKPRQDLLFSGKLNLWANILMIKKIVNFILPKVREIIPNLKLNIVGAFPRKSILKLQNDFINIKANVPEIVPYLQGASVFIHPHFAATGIQNKILEAMSCGCPIVTTPTGIQGIPVRNGIEAMVAENDNEIVQHTIKLLQDKEFAAQLGQNARKCILETHTWEIVFKDLDNIIDEL